MDISADGAVWRVDDVSLVPSCAYYCVRLIRLEFVCLIRNNMIRFIWFIQAISGGVALLKLVSLISGWDGGGGGG